jgi:hypothetical protein
MSHELRESSERRAVRESSFEGFKPRNLQAADQGFVERRRAQVPVRVERRVHVAMVAGAPPTTPDDWAGKTATAADNSAVDLSVAIPLALARAGLSHKQACAYMGVDTGNWARALHGEGHVSLQRLLKLPIAFWCEFLPLLAEPAGLAVTHDDMAAITLKRAAVAFELLAAGISAAMRRAG